MKSLLICIICFTELLFSISCYYKAHEHSRTLLRKCPALHGYACMALQSSLNTTIYSLGCNSAETCPDVTVCERISTDVYFCCCHKDGCNIEPFDYESSADYSVNITEAEPEPAKSSLKPILLTLPSFWVVAAFIFVIFLTLLITFVLQLGKIITGTKGSSDNIKMLRQRAGGNCVSVGHLSFLTTRLMKGQFSGSERLFKTDIPAKLVKEIQLYDLLAPDHLSLIVKLVHVVNINANHKFALVFEYLEDRSLFDVLKNNLLRLEYPQLIQLVQSFASGLAFLHGRRRGRPPITHRNIKSTKILLRRLNSELFAVIRDLSHAVAFDGLEDQSLLTQVGDIHYMAPELLSGVVGRDHTAYLSIDMYAFSLVVWEMLANCGGCEYARPFEGVESLDDMRRSVVVEKRRPDLLIEWNYDKRLSPLCRIIADCWDSDPSLRLSAQCVYHILEDIC